MSQNDGSRAACLLPAVLAASLALSGCLPAAADERSSPPPKRKIVAVGDIGDDSPLPHFQDETAQLVARIDPKLVLALGDNAYPGGTLADFRANYDPWWGGFKSKTRPVPGNHEQVDYDRGYNAYFGPGRRNYSYDLGNWHLIALDTNLGDSSALGFLRRDLAETRKPCLLMYLHHPLYTSGSAYTGGIEGVKPLYQAFRARGGDLVLTAHEHNYERFAKQSPGNRADRHGYRQIVAGSGGQDLRGFTTAAPNSQVRISQHGVTRVVLKPSSYKADFIGVWGARDSVPRTACNR